MLREDIAAEIQNLLSIPSWDWDAELEEALEKIGREYLKEREGGENNDERKSN